MTAPTTSAGWTEHRVTSADGLLDLLFPRPIGTRSLNLQGKLAYRGAGDATWVLTPTALRNDAVTAYATLKGVPL